jgi:shikimate dehydrogenase
MRKFGLIGYPLGHSFSKQYFSDKFTLESITDCAYENYPLTSIELLDELISGDHEICGLNVTIPFKSEVIKYLDYLDEEAASVGAVNVIKISQKDYKRVLKGFNTDIYGFRESIIPFLTKATANALILGTGGSSKAVAYVLGSLGISITNVSRNSGPGLITYEELTDKLLADNQLIVNTTPLGMFPAITGLPDLNYDLLTDKHILYDLVYNPEMTSFLKAGKQRGCKIVGGLRMLHLQAEKAWNIWNDDNI